MQFWLYFPYFNAKTFSDEMTNSFHICKRLHVFSHYNFQWHTLKIWQLWIDKYLWCNFTVFQIKQLHKAIIQLSGLWQSYSHNANRTPPLTIATAQCKTLITWSWGLRYVSVWFTCIFIHIAVLFRFLVIYNL